MYVGVVGGGAAGFFAAIAAKEKYPSATVVVLEKSLKVLSKVKISGGGRCNLTNGCETLSELCKAYPRGGRELKRAFHTFSNKNAMEWFEQRGVPLVTQSDGCVFPVSQESQSIIDCFLREAKRLGIAIVTGKEVKSIIPVNGKLEIDIAKEQQLRIFDKVVVTTGGSPRKEGLAWLEALGHKIEAPVPSLFSFNMTSEPITKLMGVVVDNVQTSIQGTKIKANGPLLITHWGMSGPAILKLSSFGARELNQMSYTFNLQVSWGNEPNNNLVADELSTIATLHSKKMLANVRPYGLSERLWLFLLERAGLPYNKKWSELGKKGMNKLVTVLANDTYGVNGKSTFTEEYVTCGGVSLQSIDMLTMESKVCKNLYLAGEVMDIDAITGGYNLQAAWTTGYIAGQLG
jgi:predicted Rossmann fold flavoprotein